MGVIVPGDAVAMDVCPSWIGALQIPRRDLKVQDLFELRTARSSSSILLTAAMASGFTPIRRRAGETSVEA
jgi:hypothetical protein